MIHSGNAMCGSTNIHTPTTEGISLRTPSSLDFLFFEVSYNPLSLRIFHAMTNTPPPPNPSGKFGSRRESVKSEATDPNLIEAKPFRLHRTCLYCLLAFKIIMYIVITYSSHILTNINCSSLGQTDILGICKITLTKACKTFVSIEGFP